MKSLQESLEDGTWYSIREIARCSGSMKSYFGGDMFVCNVDGVSSDDFNFYAYYHCKTCYVNTSTENCYMLGVEFFGNLTNNLYNNSTYSSAYKYGFDLDAIAQKVTTNKRYLSGESGYTGFWYNQEMETIGSGRMGYCSSFSIRTDIVDSGSYCFSRIYTIDGTKGTWPISGLYPGIYFGYLLFRVYNEDYSSYSAE